MAFLGRSRKEDLWMMATELGLAPSDNLKIIELKDLITKSDGYDVEFVKNVLNVIVEERTATVKQKAAEMEKQKAVAVAQQQEREFELEKFKIQLEMQKLSQAPVVSQQLENPKLELNRIIARFNSPRKMKNGSILDNFRTSNEILEHSRKNLDSIPYWLIAT
ncbi:hypothetical protein TNCT_242231 [Trichonephila clavata]|uniref:Uncharacterized protein n=1 Tax=Trichonephila clavata TaxID=2740835 RepID=A0A8X6H2W6_TRICU|nr:hypothetical protein TNCT_242231 [Trichonephila clavata]